MQLDASSLSGTGLRSRSAASSLGPGGAPSYSLSRGRAVSPVISNYFGLPTEAPKQRSLSAQGSRNQGYDGSRLGDGLLLWGKKLKYTYGLFSKPESQDNDLGDDEDGEDDKVTIKSSEEEEEEDEEEEDDDDDDDDDFDGDKDIDIFGHP